MALAFPAGPVLMAAAVLALGVPMVRLTASYPDAAPGGGAPGQVALQAAAAVCAVAAGAALVARRATAVCGTLLMLAGPAIVIAAVPVAPARPALLFTIVLAGAALAPALLGSAALTCPVGPLRGWDRLAVAVSLLVAGLVSGLMPAVLFDAKASGCFTCAANLAEVHAAPDLRASLIRWGLALTIGTGTGVAALAAWRWLRAPRIVRLVNAPVAIGGAAVALLSAAAAGHALAQPVPVIDAQSRAIWLAQCTIVVLMAGGVAATALRTRRLASRPAGRARRPTRGVRAWPSPRCGGPAGRSPRSGTGLSWPVPSSCSAPPCGARAWRWSTSRLRPGCGRKWLTWPHHGGGSSRTRTRNGGAWNVTCMTAPSSGLSGCSCSCS